MSESKMVTEREAVMRERAAFVRGSQFEDEAWREMLRVNHSSGADCIDASRKRYPLPKVERPRVIFDQRVDSHREFRFVDDMFQTRRRSRTSEWTEDGMDGWAITPDVVRVFADLLANPTELVEDTP